MKLFKVKLILACIWLFTIQQNILAMPVTRILLDYAPCTNTALMPQEWLSHVIIESSNWIFYDANSSIIGTLTGNVFLTQTPLPVGTRYVGGEVFYYELQLGARYQNSLLQLDVMNPAAGHLITTTDNDICNGLTITPATHPRSNCKWDVVADIPANISTCVGPITQIVWNYRLISNPLCVRGASSGIRTLSGTRLPDRLVVGATYQINLTIIFQNARQVRCTGFTVTIPDPGNCDACRRGKDIVVETSNNITRLFPNPTSNAISVETNDINISKIEIYDAVGKLWLQQETALSNNVYLEVGKLNQGLYFVKIYDENGQLLETQKLLIQK